jgi:hypothetical protein
MAATPTTVTTTAHLDLVRNLGASEAFDYRAIDPAQLGTATAHRSQEAGGGFGKRVVRMC